MNIISLKIEPEKLIPSEARIQATNAAACHAVYRLNRGIVTTLSLEDYAWPDELLSQVVRAIVCSSSLKNFTYTNHGNPKHVRVMCAAIGYTTLKEFTLLHEMIPPVDLILQNFRNVIAPIAQKASDWLPLLKDSITRNPFIQQIDVAYYTWATDHVWFPTIKQINVHKYIHIPQNILPKFESETLLNLKFGGPYNSEINKKIEEDLKNNRSAVVVQNLSRAQFHQLIQTLSNAKKLIIFGGARLDQ